MNEKRMEYVGFWSRVGATLLDWLILWLLSLPFLLFSGNFFFFEDSSFIHNNFWFSALPPAIYVILFWKSSWQGTPGKRMIRARIVDAKTGNPATLLQCIVRYLCYFVSVVPLFLGIIWVALDSKKRGWHDLIAGTVVVREKKKSEIVEFSEAKTEDVPQEDVFMHMPPPEKPEDNIPPEDPKPNDSL